MYKHKIFVILCFFLFFNVFFVYYFNRIKEEPCSEIQFPVFDENDDITDEHLLQLEGIVWYFIGPGGSMS